VVYPENSYMLAIYTCTVHNMSFSLYPAEKIGDAEMSNVTSVERVASAPRSGGPSRDASANPCYTARPCQELGETTGDGFLLPELVKQAAVNSWLQQFNFKVNTESKWNILTNNQWIWMHYFSKLKFHDWLRWFYMLM